MAADDAKIIDLIKARPADAGPFVSFEFFPPRTDDGVANLLKRLDRMAAQEPLFTDFTWGAGGSTADLTYQLTLEAQKRGLLPNMHLTCTNMDAALIKKALDDCKANGIRNICALRGDPARRLRQLERHRRRLQLRARPHRLHARRVRRLLRHLVRRLP